MSVGIVDKQTGDRIPTAGMPAIDNALSATSINPVQNAIITAALANKQDKTDNNLETTSKTVVGAVNELMSGLIDVNSNIFSLAGLLDYRIGVYATSKSVSGNQDVRKMKLTIDSYGYMSLSGILLARYGVYAINITCDSNGAINAALMDKIIEQDNVSAGITYSGNEVTIDFGYQWASGTLILAQPSRSTDTNKIPNITVTYSAS